MERHPPWLRDQKASNQQGFNLQQQLGLQQMVGFQQNPNLFNQAVLQQQQSLMQQLPAQLFNQAVPVSYPTPRTLNTMAFSSNQPQSMQQQQQQQQQPTNQSQSKFASNRGGVFSGTGTVTKIQGECGFIDDECFFHRNVCVKGSYPKVGDRVLVEATSNTSNSNWKWQATRVQVLSSSSNTSSIVSHSSNHTSKSSNYGGALQPTRDISEDSYRRRDYSPPRRSSPRRGRSRDRDDSRRDIIIADDLERKRRRDEREKEREKRDRSIERRERSPIRRPSPKRRRARAVPRYMVQIPKIELTLKLANVLELKRRYSTLYVPSDFFYASNKWVDAFPPHSPLSLKKPCSFHVMHKEVEPLLENTSVYDAPDADYLYSAKVMLMATPPFQDLLHKCFVTAEEKELEKYDEERTFIHPSRLINFLVGIRGKNETCAIGGAWSPSLDGADPQDPQVLIRTAIRTCKALTGIDLSNCTQWYRFVELYYRRSEQTQKSGRVIPARTETVVIFLPDVSSCLPTRLEYDKLRQDYKEACDKYVNPDPDGEIQEFKKKIYSFPNEFVDRVSKIPTITIPDDGDIVDNSKQQEPSNNDAVVADSQNNDSAATAAAENSKCSPESDDVEMVDATGTNETNNKINNSSSDGPEKKQNTSSDAADAVAIVNSNSGNDKDTDDVVEAGQPTHFSKLDPKNMKVNDLKVELKARNLSTKGLKNQLVSRLTKALKVEADPSAAEKETLETCETEDHKTDTQESEDVYDLDNELDIADVTIIDEYDSTKSEDKMDESEKHVAQEKREVRRMSDKEKRQWEKRYTLPDNTSIIVHPSKTAKSGKFDCTVMSLSVLLDYRQEDTKEHSFEVSLFAELFNEMLMRDYGFNIYKALNILPEEEKKKKENETHDETAGEDKKDDSRDGDAKKDDDKSDKDKDKDKDKKSSRASSRDRDRERDRARSKERKRRDSDRDRRRRGDESDNESFSTRSESRERSKNKDNRVAKYVTVYPELLLSFVYFDTTQCGYIFEKDIEDLFYALGLNLSRSQSRKIAEKFVIRDALYYRKLTDKLKDEEFTNLLDNVDDEVLRQLGCGNMPHNRRITSGSSEGEPDTKKFKTPETADGQVVYKGVLYDIQKLLEKMTKADNAKETTETVLVDMRKQNNELTTNYSKATSKIKDLSSELKSTSRKLADCEQQLSSANRRCSDYYNLLINIRNDITSHIGKEKSTSSRHESSRDKDKSDREQRSHENKDKQESKENTKKECKSEEKSSDSSEKDKSKEKEKEIESEEIKSDSIAECVKKENSADVSLE